MRIRTLRSVIFFAAGIGLVVSIFATAEYFEAALQSLCTVSTFFSCAAVANSGRTTTLGIPDYLWGMLGFIAILVVAGIAEARPEDPRWVYALLGLTTAGVALALYFLYVELALINALCLVCASAYVMGGIAWAGAIGLAAKARRGDLSDPGDEDEESDD